MSGRKRKPLLPLAMHPGWYSESDSFRPYAKRNHFIARRKRRIRMGREFFIFPKNPAPIKNMG